MTLLRGHLHRGGGLFCFYSPAYLVFSLIIRIFVALTIRNSMGRPPKHRAIVKLDEAKTTPEGILIISNDTIPVTGVVVQSAIDNIPGGSRVALTSDPLAMITLPEGEFASIHEDQILMLL